VRPREAGILFESIFEEFWKCESTQAGANK